MFFQTVFCSEKLPFLIKNIYGQHVLFLKADLNRITSEC
ncbi:hypothetical protein BTN50_1468 [Candidatus Enterovibrio altilux]|uniref:Uncharacterized protein n=1 Tax=Candidatus Enterovibrio altilux TaxID=1927128 RepID=A0A291BAB1_9GAMM|nr:hypothetical protein BTN50_1468 [Candidatus Enterovibrio luxaltus]